MFYIINIHMYNTKQIKYNVICICNKKNGDPTHTSIFLKKLKIIN